MKERSRAALTSKWFGNPYLWLNKRGTSFLLKRIIGCGSDFVGPIRRRWNGLNYQVDMMPRQCTTRPRDIKCFHSPGHQYTFRSPFLFLSSTSSDSMPVPGVIQYFSTIIDLSRVSLYVCLISITANPLLWTLIVQNGIKSPNRFLKSFSTMLLFRIQKPDFDETSWSARGLRKLGCGYLPGRFASWCPVRIFYCINWDHGNSTSEL